MNEIGLSDPSDEHAIIAARVPDQPTDLVVVRSTEELIEFTWPIPYNGGSPITFFKLYWDQGAATWEFLAFTVDSDNVFLMDYDLLPGTYYSFKVIAVNDVGESVISDAYTFICAARPGVPGKPFFTGITATSITISWEPALGNGTPVTNHKIYQSTNEGSFSLHGESAANEYTATGLNTGNNFKYKVIALSAAG